MSRNTIIGIVVAVVVVGGGAWWYMSSSNGNADMTQAQMNQRGNTGSNVAQNPGAGNPAPVGSTAPATNASANTNLQTNPGPGNPAPIGPSSANHATNASGASDSQMNQDATNIDTQMSGLNSDNTSADNGMQSQ